MVQMSSAKIKTDFYRVELNKTIWDVPQRYQNLIPVGVGAYSQVCSAVDTQKNTKVAIKKLARPFQSANRARWAYRELRMLEHMNHENIAGLLDMFTASTNVDDFNDIYLVSPLMGADLNNIIKTQTLNDDHVQFLVYQILRGLKYVHSAGIIHLHLKPSKFGVNEDCELKILDFGLTLDIDNPEIEYIGQKWYKAPELVYNEMQFRQTVDIWSVGCIMAEMLTGKPLFPGLDHIDHLTRIFSLVGTPNQALLDRINNQDARDHLASIPKCPKKDFKEVFLEANPNAINLLEKMLDLDADNRITAADALAHPYLAVYADLTDEPTAEPFYESFEEMELTVPEWKVKVYEEVVNYKPQ